MPTEEHYFVEQTDDGRFAVRAKGSERASGVFDTQEQAVARVKELNSDDHPDVERVRNVASGGRDQWRSDE
jgi:uncharacterized protein YdaT